MRIAYKVYVYKVTKIIESELIKVLGRPTKKFDISF